MFLHNKLKCTADPEKVKLQKPRPPKIFSSGWKPKSKTLRSPLFWKALIAAKKNHKLEFSVKKKLICKSINFQLVLSFWIWRWWARISPSNKHQIMVLGLLKQIPKFPQMRRLLTKFEFFFQFYRFFELRFEIKVKLKHGFSYILIWLCVFIVSCKFTDLLTY